MHQLVTLHQLSSTQIVALAKAYKDTTLDVAKRDLSMNPTKVHMRVDVSAAVACGPGSDASQGPAAIYRETYHVALNHPVVAQYMPEILEEGRKRVLAGKNEKTAKLVQDIVDTLPRIQKSGPTLVYDPQVSLVEDFTLPAKIPSRKRTK